MTPIDSDGDGISDEQENSEFILSSEEDRFYLNPQVADFPYLNIQFNKDIDFGLRFTTSFESSVTNEIKITSTESVEETSIKKRNNAQNIKNNTEIKFKSDGFSLPSFDASNTTNIDLSLGRSFDEEKIQKFRKEVIDAKTKLEVQKKDIKSDAGFIATSITISNPSSRRIIISNLSFQVVLVDKDNNILTIPFSSVEIADLGNSTQSYALKPFQGPTDLRIEILKIDTERMLDVINSKNRFAFKLLNYELEIQHKSNSLKWSTQSETVGRKTLSLRIIDEDFDATYFVAKKNNGKYNKMEDCLNILGYDVKIDDMILNNKTVKYISKLRNKTSELKVLNRPIEKDNYEKGFWYVFYNKGTQREIDIDSEIKGNGVSITLMYMKGKDFIEEKNFEIAYEQSHEFNEDNIEYLKNYDLKKLDSLVVFLSPRFQNFPSLSEERHITVLKCPRRITGEPYDNNINGLYKFVDKKSYDGLYDVKKDSFGFGLRFEDNHGSIVTVPFTEFKPISEDNFNCLYYYYYVLSDEIAVNANKVSIYYNQNIVYPQSQVERQEGFTEIVGRDISLYEQECNRKVPTEDMSYINSFLHLNIVSLTPMIKTNMKIKILRVKNEQ